jgi:hypothetical protein
MTAWSQTPIPELIYYKFDGSGTTVPNLALTPPAGAETGTIVNQTQGGAGQCGGALIGNGQSSTSNYVNTNWAPVMGTSWTISFWTNNIPSTTSTYYVFGDVNAGGWRIFTGGVAGAGNWILRGAFTDILANGGAATGPTLTTFVYDMPANEMRSYVNGVLNSTVPQAGVVVSGTGPLKVGGYSSSASLPPGSLMDEFRLYDRALSLAEIQQLMITSTSSTVSITACESYTVPSGDETHTTSGTYMDTIYNVAGCDSIMTINLTITQPSASTISPVACSEYISPSGNYTWTTSGTYLDTIPNAVGCDSVITVNLTINQPTSATISPVACIDYTSPSGNDVWTVSGTYMDTIPNAVGCDSVITVELTINQPTASTITAQACEEYTSPSGTYTWMTSGTYMDTIPNLNGCDSVITIDLTINNATSSSLTVAQCGDYTAPDGAVYDTSGTYQATLTDIHGCDSVITIDLTIAPLDTSLTLVGGTLTAVSQPGVTFQWVDCGTMQPISGETGPSFTPIVTGSYSVLLFGPGCEVSSNCWDMIIFGVSENQLAELSLFPNPVRSELSIANPLAKALTLHLFDSAGKQIGTTVSSETTITIGMNTMAPGIYLLRATSGEAEQTFRIVKN